MFCEHDFSSGNMDPSAYPFCSAYNTKEIRTAILS